MKKLNTPEARKRAAMKKGAVTLKQRLAKDMKDPEFARAYRSPLIEAYVAEQLCTMRQEAGLSQSALAEKVGMKQPALARIERGEVNMTIGTMQRLAGAMGHVLQVGFVRASATR